MNYAEMIKSGPTVKPPRIVLVGVEGVGKSTAGAQMPNPIFLCAENGLVGEQFAETKNISPKSWEELLGFVDYLRTEKHEYKTLVIDTLDWLEPELYRFICQRDSKPDKKLKSVEDYGYGKGYVVACDEFRGLLSKLESLNNAGMGIMFLAHVQIKAFNNPTGDNYDRYEMKVAKQISALVKEWADAVLFARFETYTEKDGAKAKGKGGDVRVAHTRHCAAWDAKNRFSLPEILPFDMPGILEAIKKGQPDDAKTITAEIEALIPLLPVDKQAMVRTWLETPRTSAQLARNLNTLRATLTTTETQE